MVPIVTKLRQFDCSIIAHQTQANELLVEDEIAFFLSIMNYDYDRTRDLAGLAWCAVSAAEQGHAIVLMPQVPHRQRLGSFANYWWDQIPKGSGEVLVTTFFVFDACLHYYYGGFVCHSPPSLSRRDGEDTMLPVIVSGRVLL